MALTTTQIRDLLAGPPARLRERGFDVLTGIAAVGSRGGEGSSCELLIRALNRRDVFNDVTPLLEALVLQP